MDEKLTMGRDGRVTSGRVRLPTGSRSPALNVGRDGMITSGRVRIERAGKMRDELVDDSAGLHVCGREVRQDLFSVIGLRLFSVASSSRQTASTLSSGI